MAPYQGPETRLATKEFFELRSCAAIVIGLIGATNIMHGSLRLSEHGANG